VRILSSPLELIDLVQMSPTLGRLVSFRQACDAAEPPTSKKQNPEKVGFSDLSGELRNIIYKSSLTTPVVIGLDVINGGRAYYEDLNIGHSSTNITPPKPWEKNTGLGDGDRKFRPILDITPALLRTCKVINLEAVLLLVSENTFCVDTQQLFEEEYEAFSLYPRLPASFKSIRQLVIRIRAPPGPMNKTAADIIGLIRALDLVGCFLDGIEVLKRCTLEVIKEDWDLFSSRFRGREADQDWKEVISRTLLIIDEKSDRDTTILVDHATWSHVPIELWEKMAREVARTNAKQPKLNPKAAIFQPRHFAENTMSQPQHWTDWPHDWRTGPLSQRLRGARWHTIMGCSRIMGCSFVLSHAHTGPLPSSFEQCKCFEAIEPILQGLNRGESIPFRANSRKKDCSKMTTIVIFK
jgi:hypothetical protein